MRLPLRMSDHSRTIARPEVDPPPINAMHVLVANRSRSVIDTITVAFDPTYIARFSDVTSTPSAARPWEVELLGVEPGEARRVHVTLQAEQYGRHAGTVSAFFRATSCPTTLNRARITVDEIYGEMHKAGLSRVEQVRWAILETSGQISFVPAEPSDKQIKARERTLE